MTTEEVPLVTVLGLKVAVAPAGSPSNASVAVPAKEPTGVRVIVAVPLFPATTMSDDGLAVSVNGGGFATTTATVLVASSGASLPSTVNVYVPGATVAAACTVSTEPALVVAVAELKDAVMPAGRFWVERLTVPVKPFTGTTLTATVADPPGVVVTVAGVARIVYVGGGGVPTVSRKSAEALPAPIAEIGRSNTPAGAVRGRKERHGGRHDVGTGAAADDFLLTVGTPPPRRTRFWRRPRQSRPRPADRPPSR